MKNMYSGILNYLALVLIGIFMAAATIGNTAFAATDISDSIEIIKTGTRTDRRTGATYVYIALKNKSAVTTATPVKAVIDTLTPDSVTVVNPAGSTGNGKPYFQYPALAPGETSAAQQWGFQSNRARFQYAVKIMDDVISITGMAVSGAPVVGTVNIKDSSNPAKTSYSAINLDGSYHLSISDAWQPPFVLWAEGWVNNKHVRLLSCFNLEEPALQEDPVIVNITPATNAIVESAIMADGGDPDLEIPPVPTSNKVQQIKEHVQTTLENIFVLFGLDPEFDLFETPIDKIGIGSDQMFDTLVFSTTETGDIEVDNTSSDNQGSTIIIDPDVPPVVEESDGDFADSLTASKTQHDQIRDVLAYLYGLFADNIITDEEFNAMLGKTAPGFLTNGYNAAEYADTYRSRTDLNVENFVSCSVLRPMGTVPYGNLDVSEIWPDDGHSEGVWVNVTTQRNGINFTWITSFVKHQGLWKWYGNRIPVRRSTNKTWARQMNYPSGAMVYLSGIHLWHNDIGNIAKDRWGGITGIAVFNPSFASEIINGEDSHCILMERREGGLDTRYRLINVPTYWDNDVFYLISEKPGDRGIDLAILTDPANREMIFIGLNDGKEPVRTWLTTIPQIPRTVADLALNSDQYFVDIDQKSISFDPDTFPSETGMFSWDFPDDPELIPVFGILGWNDQYWNWNEFQIDNPSWYSAGNFMGWNFDYFLPTNLTEHIREAEFNCYFRHPNSMTYASQQRFNPWIENFISLENNELVFDVSHAWSPDNLYPDWSSMSATTQIRGKMLNRFETTVMVEEASTVGNAYVETELSLRYQAREDTDFGQRDFLLLGARIWYQSGGDLRLRGFVWASNNDEGSGDGYSVPAPEVVEGGGYPFGKILAFNTPYKLAVEYLEAENKLKVEFDDGSGPQSSKWDMSALNTLAEHAVFDKAYFLHAEIRTRVRSLQQSGDSGAIKVRCDNAKVDNILYDDFNNGLGNSKWHLNANE